MHLSMSEKPRLGLPWPLSFHMHGHIPCESAIHDRQSEYVFRHNRACVILESDRPPLDLRRQTPRPMQSGRSPRVHRWSTCWPEELMPPRVTSTAACLSSSV